MTQHADFKVFTGHLASVCLEAPLSLRIQPWPAQVLTLRCAYHSLSTLSVSPGRFDGVVGSVRSPDIVLKMNTELRVLEITSSPEGVQIDQQEVEERLGPVKELSTAVWTELLRTRQGLGALNLVQKLTGCRLHLQRNASHVRLFGSAHAAAMASALLEHLEGMCDEAQGSTSGSSSAEARPEHP